jgi:hypothetical protein
MSEIVVDVGMAGQYSPQEEMGSRILGLAEDNDAHTDLTGQAALVSICDASGYDVERCYRIAGVEDDLDGQGRVRYFAAPNAPVSRTNVAVVTQELLEQGSGHVFYDRHFSGAVPELLQQAFSEAGLAYDEVKLLDDMATKGNEQASISLYGFSVDPERPAEPVNSSIDAWIGEYRSSVAAGAYEHDLQNGEVMLKGDEIDDEMYSKMWKLYVDRFQWLGEKHPVSMEDTEHEFSSVLRSPNTVIAASFKDGEPNCFAYMTSDIESVYWLNSDFLHDNTKMHNDKGYDLLFFPGIVANANSTGQAGSVIGLMARTAADANMARYIVFENTNRSEVYIPRLVHGYINRSGRLLIAMPEMLDRTYYGCLEFGRMAMKSATQVYTSEEM